MRSHARANSYDSRSESTSEIVSESLERIHLSIPFSDATSGSAPSIVAPFIIAKRVAFQSFVAKFREPPTQSSASAWSFPGFAPRANVNRRASVPYLSINSIGSIVFPRLLDIFLPN